MTALLSIEAVNKKFGSYKALNNINLSVQQGEFIALLGPSGCGKTTLLRTLGGFLRPDSGNILIEGTDITSVPSYKRPLNTVFQNYALFPHMSVIENVSYGPRRQGIGKQDALGRAQEALDMVGLLDFAHRRPRQLSGGQQQRVALARAIVNKPKLLLLDEPLSALDLKLRKRMQLELKTLQEKLGIAFIFVTHDQEEALTMADRVVVMNGGNIEQIGDGDAIYSKPNSRFVADFIGDANLLPCSVGIEGEVTFEFGYSKCDSLKEYVPGTYVAVLRPEDLSIGTPPKGSDYEGCCTIRASVSNIVNMGSHSMFYLTVGKTVFTARVMGSQACNEMQNGQQVDVYFRLSDIHLIRE